MRHTLRNRNRDGFTLVEILVALILFAVISAFVVPDVIIRADDADAPRLLADVTEISTGVELFKIDLKSHYPDDIEDLVSPITTSDANIKGSGFVTADINRWDGPYLKLSLNNGGTVSTGYKGRISDDFALVTEGTTSSVAYWGGANTDDPIVSGDCVKTNYITLIITGLNEADFEQANDQIDGTGETDGGAAAGSQFSGRLRFKKTTDGTEPDSTFYLVTPCR